VPYLWSVYQDNVEPLLKILHVPTTEVLLRDARKNSEKLTPAAEALVFSIYYAAVISLEAEEVLHHSLIRTVSRARTDSFASYRFRRISE
jgi:hypothetical protein